MTDLEVAEIRYENGHVKYRYSRYLASDGSRWIRHGPFAHTARTAPWYPKGPTTMASNMVHGTTSIRTAVLPHRAHMIADMK